MPAVYPRFKSQAGLDILTTRDILDVTHCANGTTRTPHGAKKYQREGVAVEPKPAANGLHPPLAPIFVNSVQLVIRTLARRRTLRPRTGYFFW